MQNYKNHVHLEGVAVAPAVIGESQKYATFELNVREEKRDDTGVLIVSDEAVPIEVWGRHVLYSRGIRQGTPLVVDGSLKFRIVHESGVERRVMWIKAHRIFAVDRTLNRRSEEAHSIRDVTVVHDGS